MDSGCHSTRRRYLKISLYKKMRFRYRDNQFPLDKSCHVVKKNDDETGKAGIFQAYADPED